MKIRDFTQETYEQLVEEIEKINRENVSPITDFFGDIFLRLGKFLHIISYESMSSDVKSYQKKILDMNDTKKSELKQIFLNTNKADQSKAKLIKNVNEQQEQYVLKLKQLSDMIQPNWSIKSAKYINSTCESYNKKMGEIDKVTNEEYKAEAVVASKRQMKTAAKTTLSGLMGAAVSIYTMPVNWTRTLATKGPHALKNAMYADTWDLIDKVFQTGNGLVGLAGGAIALGIASSKNDNAVLMQEALKTKQYAEAESVADAMVASGMDEDAGVVKLARGLTTGAAVRGIMNGVKDTVTKGEGILPSNPIATHEVLRKKDMLPEYQQNYRHIQHLYNKFEKEGNIAKNIKWVYDIGADLWDINQPNANKRQVFTEKIAGKSKICSDAEKVIGFVQEDIIGVS